MNRIPAFLNLDLSLDLKLNLLLHLSLFLFPFHILFSQITQSVNPFIGTDAHGHTFPGATVPFGMVQLSPDTRVEGWDACGGYHYSDSTILGFSHTHLSGTGIPDYGDILFLPVTGTPGARMSQPFSHEEEEAHPGYYRVEFVNDHITAELTTTTRAAVHRYTFPKSSESNILIDLHHGLGPDKVLDSWLEFSSGGEVRGYRQSTGWAKDQRLYFVARFSKKFSQFGNLNNLSSSEPRITGTDVKGYVQFSTSENEMIMVKVGISSVDLEGALKNLESEIPDWNFEGIRNQAGNLWESELGKIKIEGGTDAERVTFYTALYHSMIAPNVSSDVDGRYRGMDGKIHTAEDFTMHTVFSLWDTFRTEHPLLTLIDQKRTSDFIRSMLSKYDESGTLPVWELASNETWTMIGYHSIPVILDAVVKGVEDFDKSKAFQAMKASAMADRFGLKFYKKYGSIPGDMDGESVSKTLEYAYDDWCIAQMARLTGNKNDQSLFEERSQYYKNIFDPDAGFMRGKRNGNWLEPFDPTSVNIDFTEANSWQYSFFVPHDIPGLRRLHGGKEQFEKKLDGLFYSGSRMTGRDQSDITGMIGQYAQGNEPSHHAAYLYNFTDASWKTQQIVRKIMDSLYTAKPDGLCGNDDCGQMSAWYVMSALGFYPLVPGTPFYVIGSPVFEKATITLENGNQFTILAPGNSQKTPYVSAFEIDGAVSQLPVLMHDAIIRGGTARFSMSSVPSAHWDALPDVLPGIESVQPIVPVPIIESKGRSFRDSMTIIMSSPIAGADIYYDLEGRQFEYRDPITISRDARITAWASKDGLITSKFTVASFTRMNRIGTLKLFSAYAPQYAAGGTDALVDGVRGGEDFRLGTWQGYEGSDLDLVLDLGREHQIHGVSLGCLQDNNAWIFFPQSVEVFFSSDGISFSRPLVVPNTIPAETPGTLIKEFETGPLAVSARYIRMHVKNLGICPPWHKGAGGKAWLFVDEISVKTKGS